MSGNRQTGDHTEMDVRQERGTNQHTVDKVVQPIANQNQGTGCSRLVLVVILGYVDFTVLVVAMAPQHQLFQQKEPEQTQQ